MKKLGIVFSVVTAVALMVVPSFAVTVNENIAVDFTVSADVPSGTQIDMTATQVLVADNSFGPEVTELDFNPVGTLTYDATANNGDGAYGSLYYFAIDIGGIGAGDLSVLSNYTEGSTNGQAEGLGNRATVTYVNQFVGSDTELSKIALIDVSSITTTVTSGWVRLYVGLAFDYTVTNAAPFTSADEPGPYNGTLTLTGTLN